MFIWANSAIALPQIHETPPDSDIYVRESNVAYKAPKRLVATFNPCSCVSYAKYSVGVPQEEMWGNAWEIKPKYSEPQDEGLVLTFEGRGHIAHYVRKGDVLYLDESNYFTCKTSTARQLHISDTRIKGYL